MINHADKIDFGAFVSEKFWHHFWQKTFSAESKWILLKNPKNASTRLSTNGKSPMISTAPPFVLRLWFDRLTTLSRVEGSKDERRVFQQNQKAACPRGSTFTKSVIPACF